MTEAGEINWKISVTAERIKETHARMSVTRGKTLATEEILTRGGIGGEVTQDKAKKSFKYGYKHAKNTLVNKFIYSSPWFVYIAECTDKTLYTGIALDLDKRIGEHNTTNKCRYTRPRKPVKLVYKELCLNHGLAMKREIEIKRYDRKKKLGLFES